MNIAQKIKETLLLELKKNLNIMTWQLLVSSGRIDTNVLGIYAVPKTETLKININLNRILHIYLVSNF